MEDFIRLLKTLSETRGPSGFKDEVREMVIREMEPYVDEVVDRWGNPALRDHIINIAREVGIPYQLEVLYGVLVPNVHLTKRFLVQHFEPT